MTSLPGDRFRTRALECIEAADSVADPGRKLALLELAQRWLNLAAQVEGVAKLSDEDLLPSKLDVEDNLHPEAPTRKH